MPMASCLSIPMTTMRVLPLSLKVMYVIDHQQLVRFFYTNEMHHVDGPGIEYFQIIGDAVPGGRLLGCGYPVRGTSLCMFQVKILAPY